jgi:hypothetical protein
MRRDPRRKSDRSRWCVSRGRRHWSTTPRQGGRRRGDEAVDPERVGTTRPRR